MNEAIEKLERLVEAANEPCPAPLPEQDSRVGEAMASRQDDRNRRQWLDRTDAARREIISALPALLAVAKAAMPFAKIAVGNEHLPDTVFTIPIIPLADARTLASRLEAIGK